MKRRPSGDHAEHCRDLARVLIPALRWRLRQLGYALGIHGSLRFDIDLIACPWREGAVAADFVRDAVREVIKAVNSTCIEPADTWVEKPYGRKAWSFRLTHGEGPYIDLSVMPREHTEPKS